MNEARKLIQQADVDELIRMAGEQLPPLWEEVFHELFRSVMALQTECNRLTVENDRLHEGMDHYRQIAALAVLPPGGHG